jgi:hypothetical protein
MHNDKELHSYAQWVLERNLQWISAAEIKAAAIVALDTAMLGALTAAFSAVPTAERTAWTVLWSLLSCACLLAALLCTAMVFLPRTAGPPSSLLFFGQIAKTTADDYADSFRKATSSGFLDDCLKQIHRNSEIACAKFEWVRRAMIWSFCAVLPWIAALACLMKA